MKIVTTAPRQHFIGARMETIHPNSEQGFQLKADCLFHVFGIFAMMIDEEKKVLTDEVKAKVKDFEVPLRHWFWEPLFDPPCPPEPRKMEIGDMISVLIKNPTKLTFRCGWGLTGRGLDLPVRAPQSGCRWRDLPEIGTSYFDKNRQGVVNYWWRRSKKNREVWEVCFFDFEPIPEDAAAYEWARYY